MCSNSLQNILDGLRRVYTLLIMTKIRACSALTCALTLLPDKRRPRSRYLHVIKRLKMAFQSPPPLTSAVVRLEQTTFEPAIDQPDADKRRGGVGFTPYD